jgi:hypothetical protein
MRGKAIEPGKGSRLFFFKGLANGREKIVLQNRFVQIGAHAHGKGFLSINKLTLPRTENDRDIGSEGDNLLGEFGAGYVRHGHIGDDQVESVRVVPEFRQGLQSIRERTHLVAVP